MKLDLKGKYSNLKLFLFYTILYISFLFIYRLIFLVTYFYRVDNATILEILSAFLVGFRFDLSVVAILLGPFLLLSSLNFLNKVFIFRFVWGYVPILIFIWVVVHSIADILYYENANKHIGYEGFVFIGKDLGVILKSALENNTIPFVTTVTLLLIFLPASTYVFLKFSPYRYNDKSMVIGVVEVVAIFVFIVISIRGGVQVSPIRASNAIISGNNFINNLGLNAIFTTIADLKSQTIPKSQQMRFEEAALIVREEIKYSGAEFISVKYPILRKLSETNTKRAPNVVLVLLENWTGKFIRPISNGLIDGKEVAPHFNALVKKGIFFNKFFATGGRTTNGMMSVLAGIPDRPGLTAVRTSQVMGNFSGIGNIFKSMGYKTLFATGGDLSFDNKNFLLPRWGFDRLYGKIQIDSMNKYKLGAWGYDDGDVFDVLHEEISKFKKDEPFLAVVLTLSTHYPYRVPEKKVHLFDEKTKDYEYLNVYHYADWALSEFLEKAKKSKYFQDTIFFFVADHAHHRYLNYYEDRNIPFLIYAPDKYKPQLREEISSQLDVIPTILGAVGKECYFSVMGRDLLSPGISKSGYFAYGNVFGWIEDDLFLYQSSEGGTQINFTAREPYIENKLCKLNRLLCEPSHRKAKAFLNLSIELMNKNLVFPPPEEIKKYYSNSGKD
ncbi:MAG: sulfatase-like hydrolase/transferase [Leptospiraceae bacterium]|nr:sulfatase-like hydrolase/transferase [Leptospiraceae bacterium]MCK6381068.1 sulfatase-like hydrolase/transferase [Leptospiraceae bacterium]